jgi:hypothetical protein
MSSPRLTTLALAILPEDQAVEQQRPTVAVAIAPCAQATANGPMVDQGRVQQGRGLGRAMELVPYTFITCGCVSVQGRCPCSTEGKGEI